MSKLVTTSDWPARLRKLVYTQFKLSNWAVPLANAVGANAQKFEALALAFMSLWSIDPIVPDSATSDPAYGVGRGVQLDRIGRLVGQSRGSAADAIYRLYLRARILANRSSGGPEDLYAVFAAMLSISTTGLLHLAPGYDGTGAGSKSLIFTIDPPIAADEAAVALQLLRDAKDAGVRAILEWQQQSDALTFTCAFASTVLFAVNPGDTSIVVPGGGLAGFPLAGTLVVDRGMAGEETIAYAISGTFVFAAPGLLHAHAVGAAVELATDAGLGFPIASVLTGATLVGDATMILASTSGFPASSTVIVDQGTAEEETIDYSSIAAPFTLNLVGTLTKTHAIGAAVVILNSQNYLPTAGGALAGAAQTAA